MSFITLTGLPGTIHQMDVSILISRIQCNDPIGQEVAVFIQKGREHSIGDLCLIDPECVQTHRVNWIFMIVHIAAHTEFPGGAKTIVMLSLGETFVLQSEELGVGT
jgi:hypothetical protein